MQCTQLTQGTKKGITLKPITQWKQENYGTNAADVRPKRKNKSSRCVSYVTSVALSIRCVRSVGWKLCLICFRVDVDRSRIVGSTDRTDHCMHEIIALFLSASNCSVCVRGPFAVRQWSMEGQKYCLRIRISVIKPPALLILQYYISIK